MIDPELAKQWKETQSFLEQARQLLPSNFHQSGGDAGLSPLADFEKYLAANELELALDELASLGEANSESCPGRFWRSLEEAALSMKLNDRADRFGRRFREHWKAHATLESKKWAAIDEEIFAHRTLTAVQGIKNLTGCDLRDAILLLHDRYAELRKMHPDRFTVSDDEYWRETYS
jgi:hypothetical protein